MNCGVFTVKCGNFISEFLAFVPFEHLFLIENIKVLGFARGIFVGKSRFAGRLPKKNCKMASFGFLYDDQDENNQVVELFPMENFTLVQEGVYRSSFPKKKNFPFIQKLRLKSVLTLILEEYPTQNSEFLEQNDIKFFQFGVAGNKVFLLIFNKRNPLSIYPKTRSVER